MQERIARLKLSLEGQQRHADESRRDREQDPLDNFLSLRSLRLRRLLGRLGSSEKSRPRPTDRSLLLFRLLSFLLGRGDLRVGLLRFLAVTKLLALDTREINGFAAALPSKSASRSLILRGTEGRPSAL